MRQSRLVTRKNVNALVALKLAPGQEKLVAPNAVTLAQATYEPESEVWGLFEGDEAVGLMAVIDMSRYPHREPGDDPSSLYLWRLMIADDRQGRGLGRFAIEECKAMTLEKGLARLTASVVDTEPSPMGFYQRLGFRPTGDRVDGEIVISLTI